MRREHSRTHGLRRPGAWQPEPRGVGRRRIRSAYHSLIWTRSFTWELIPRNRLAFHILLESAFNSGPSSRSRRAESGWSRGRRTSYIQELGSEWHFRLHSSWLWSGSHAATHTCCYGWEMRRFFSEHKTAWSQGMFSRPWWATGNWTWRGWLRTMLQMR